MSRARIFTGTVVCLVLGLYGSCYRTRVQSYTPDRKLTIAIQESCGFPDCMIQLANIVWSDDGTKAGVLVPLSDCPNIYVTYDFTTGTLRPGEEMEDLQAASL